MPALAQTGTPGPAGPSSGSFPAADAPPPPATTGTAPGAPPPASSPPADTTAEPPAPPPTPPPAPPPPSTEPQRRYEPEPGDEPEPYSRRGFFFSLGIGCSVTSLLCTADSGNGFFPAFATKFQIGAAVSDTTIVHWTSRVEWRTYANQSFDTDGDLETRTEVHPWAVAGVGLTHFFSETPTSLYIGGDIGFSNMMDLDSGDNDFGFGLCEALGWEFQPNFSVEHALCLGTSDDGNDHTPTSPFLASLTLNWLTK
jgi:hypothetical protein